MWTYFNLFFFFFRYAAPLYIDMSKRTQIARPQDPNDPRTNPNDLFVDEGSEAPPKTKVFVGKVDGILFIERHVINLAD